MNQLKNFWTTWIVWKCQAIGNLPDEVIRIGDVGVSVEHRSVTHYEGMFSTPQNDCLIFVVTT
ncbi:MAG TPA: hypothetical protein VEU96_04205 [Bryobacteraceae bacterium]|nr:hypothetical protein [Bryobacteraceae bacterium]